MTTQVGQLNVFISSPAGTDLSQLLEALAENNIHALDLAEFAPGAVKITDKIIDGINHADLVIGVLGTANSSGNVLFELGCASALGKRVLAIIPESYEIPSDIKDLVYIRTTPNNREAVNFALEQILNAPEEKTKQQARLNDSSKALGMLADHLLKRLESLGKTPSKQDVEDIVREMLEVSGVKTLMKPKYSEIHPDFAVWINELEPYFGNPILIEVKGQIQTARQAKYLANQVLHYMSISSVMAVIIFAAQMSSEALNAVSLYPNLYFFELHDFLKRLRQESFGQIVRKERNARVHGIIG